MNITSQQIQKYSDNIIERLFLWAIPHWLKPNFFSYIRIALVPVMYILLINEHYYYGLIVFVVAACTDFIDGTLARKRDQITELGKVLDPIADKLLILSVLLFIGFKYWIVWVFSLFIIGEIIMVLVGAFFQSSLGLPISSNMYGKMKMILQSFSVAFFMIGIMINNLYVIRLSEYLLVAALVLAVISGGEQLRVALKNRKRLQEVSN